MQREGNAVRIKRYITVLLLTISVLAGCGGKQEDLREAEQNPLAVAGEQGVIHYGDTRDEVEKVLGTDSISVAELLNCRQYPDGIQIIYRETGGEERAVLILVRSSEYSTYQGVRTGSVWNDVKDSLGETAETKTSAIILFQDSEQIDPWTAVHERSDDCISISYIFSHSGIIQSITICDHQAGTAFK